MAESEQEIGKNCLSPALRQHFSFIGYFAVKRDVMSQRYSSDKQTAALMWLREKDAVAQVPTMQRDWDKMTSRENAVTRTTTRKIDEGVRIIPASPLARAVSGKQA